MHPPRWEILDREAGGGSCGYSMENVNFLLSALSSFVACYAGGAAVVVGKRW